MKHFTLKLTSAIVINGEILTRDSLVEVDEQLARNLLHRGKAVLATDEDSLDEGDDVDLSKLNKSELLALADELQIEGADKLGVEKLRAAIEAKRAE